MAIRKCTRDDINFMIEVAREAYPDGFDEKATRDWMWVRLESSDMVFFRGERTVGTAMMQARFHAPNRKQCYMIHIAASRAKNGSSWEPVAILDALAQWGKDNGATKFWFADITGVDLAAYAKRRGGQLAGHTYVLDLDGKGNRYG